MLIKCKFNPIKRIKLIMTNNFPPNTDPNIFAFTATIVGALAVDDFNSYELAAIANWIILLGQYILTYSSQLQLIESRIEGYNINANSKQFKQGGSPYAGGRSNQTSRKEIDYLYDAIVRIEKELQKLKKEI